MSIKVGSGTTPALAKQTEIKPKGESKLKKPVQTEIKPHDDYEAEKGPAASHDVNLGKKVKPKGRASGLINISRAMQQANVGSPAAPPLPTRPKPKTADAKPPVPPRPAKKAEQKAPPLPPRSAKKAQLPAREHKDFLSQLKNAISKLPEAPLKAAPALLDKGLQQAEQASGLKKTVSKEIGGQKTWRAKKSTHNYLAGVAKVDSEHHVEAQGRAKAQGQAKVGIAGAEAKGRADLGATAKAHSQGKITTDAGELDYAADAQTGMTGQAQGQAKIDATGMRAQGDVGAEAKAQVGAAAHLHNAVADGHVAAGASARAYAKAQGHGRVDATGLRGELGGQVGAEAEAHVEGDFRSAGVKLGGERLDVNGHAKGYVKAGATAQARVKADATLKPPRAGAEIGGKAFAGAKAGVQGKVGLGDLVSVKGHAAAWAGAGAEGIAKLGFDDGKLRIAFGAGTALGYGAGAGGSVEIDVKKIGKLAIGAVTDPVNTAKQVEKLGTDVVKSVAGLGKTVEKSTQAIHTAAKSIIGKTVGSLLS